MSDNNTVPLIPAYIVERSVGELHVSTPYLEVVRHMASKIKGGRKGFLKLGRQTKRFAIASAIWSHARNRAEYVNVMHCKKVRLTNPYRFNADAQEVTVERGTLS